MTTFQIGQTVRLQINNKKAFGTVRSEATLTASGKLVSVELLPDFTHLLPTGWTDVDVEDLTAVRICGCATLAYRPQFGDKKGQLFTTGCDFSRMPGRNSKFLPGHDARAKSFLIEASGETATMENGKNALDNARDFSDKIAMKVAEGMDNDRRKRETVSRSKRRGVTISAVDSNRPAVREDELTNAQRLQREHKVTDAMITILVRGALNDLAGYRGAISGPAGTEVALMKRGLSSCGRVTTLGYQVIDQPLYADENPDHVGCTDAQGSYEQHAYRMNREENARVCRRCDEVAPDDSEY